MADGLQELISTIKKIKAGTRFKRYIDFIRFPFYRNLEVNTEIKFDFPLTVFIGQNGCGKSSCLHALYGSPERYTPYNFWFDTKVDPVKYYDDKKRRHSFWYSYLNDKGDKKEVVKARIKRKDDPNYWETSRPLAWAGMKTRANRNDRDKPIKKNVVYLDFRSELSAFDKYFYFGTLKNTTASNKQEFIRRKSPSLNNLFTKNKDYIYSAKGALNKKVEELTAEELKWISFILGREYKFGHSVLHRLFRNEGYSVLFETSFAKYSEAFAGSGEMAVVRLVREVLSAENYSLILLDEPEVSLHPGAQHRLKLFLLEQIKRNKHQVILTTHSPTIVEGLPKESIKVFFQNPRNGRFLVKDNLLPEEAFYHIEFDTQSKKVILVEDKLAKAIVEGVLEKIGPEKKNLFLVKYNPGGEAVIKKEFISVYCREEKSNTFIFFDGDQTPNKPHIDWREFPANQVDTKFLASKIKEQTGEEIKFSVDGNAVGGNKDQQEGLQKKYLDYYHSNVFYLPENIPEEIVWDYDYALKLITAQFEVESKQDELVGELKTIVNTKDKFAFISRIIQGDDSAIEVFSVQKQFLQRWLRNPDKNYTSIIETVEKIIS